MKVGYYFLVLLFFLSCSENGNPGDPGSGQESLESAVLHGITVDIGGEYIYVSSRENGNIHKISTSGNLIYSKTGLGETGMVVELTGIAISDTYDKIYVTDQGTDHVIVLDATSPTLEVIETISIDYDSEEDVDCSVDNMQDCMSSSGCEWDESMEMCMESDSDGGMQMGSNNIPHFIVIDEINKYWFVTAFGTGKVGMYDLEDDLFRGSVDVGSTPALMVLDEISQTLYVSRMMDMMMNGMVMEGGDNELFVLNYDSGSLINSTSIDLTQSGEVINFPTPHALSISGNRDIIYTASNTADIAAKITNNGSNIEVFAIDPDVIDLESGINEFMRLNPIQTVQSDDYVFITCSANSSGQWQSDSGNYYDINGQVIMFNISDNSYIDRYKFNFDNGYNSPWHMVKSPVNDEIYLTLGSGSVACLEFNGTGLTEKWILDVEE